MADEKQTLALDLDVKGFVAGAQHANKTLKELGDVENISGLLEGFAQMGVTLGIVAAAVYAVKKTLDLTMEAEAIHKVNAQFDLLAQNAGQFPEHLRSGLEKSVDGLMDMEDVLHLANKAIVELGVNAGKIPEIMEMARKVTNVFGGELGDNFAKISQAAATGNTRLLRTMGIVVDNDKALRDYARSVGKFVSDLTDQEKKTATLNAILEKQKTALKGVHEDTSSVTAQYTRLKVAIKELFDFVAIAYERIFGGGFRAQIAGASDLLHKFTNYLQANFGTGIDKTRAQAERLKEEFKEQSAEVERLQKLYDKQSASQSDMAKVTAKGLETQKAKLADLQAQLQQYDTYLEKHDEQVKASAEAAERAAPKEKDEEKFSARLKFESDLLKLQQARVEEEIKNETDVDAFRSEMIEKRALMEMELFNRLREVDENAKKEGIQGTEMVENEKLEIRRKYAMEIEALDRNLADQELRIMQNLADRNKYNASGFAAGWKVASKQAANDFMNFSTLGQKANQILTKSLSAGFKAMGDGSENAAEAMKKAFLGQIGDEAMARGEFLLASSLWPPQPLGLLAGGALVALGSKLKSLSGGGGAMGASAGGGGGGGAGFSAPESMPDTMSTLQTSEEAKKQRAVTIQVQGNYFETEATKRSLMEMIRSETDATSFSYVQINQGGAS